MKLVNSFRDSLRPCARLMGHLSHDQASNYTDDTKDLDTFQFGANGQTPKIHVVFYLLVLHLRKLHMYLYSKFLAHLLPINHTFWPFSLCIDFRSKQHHVSSHDNEHAFAPYYAQHFYDNVRYNVYCGRADKHYDATYVFYL